mgnify:CR=1 FL=1
MSAVQLLERALGLDPGYAYQGDEVHISLTGQNLLMAQDDLLLDLGDERGVWRVSGRWIEATTSRRLDAEPLVDRSTPVWYATFGVPRLPDGMHSITTGGRRTLLNRRP